MATYLKRASRTPETGAADTRETVERMLRDIEARGEPAVREYAEQLDGWTGDFVVGADAIARAGASLSPQVREDIAFAHAQVHAFARRQRESLLEFETELYPGLVTGQRLIPVNVAGCYVPSGRYAHIASAIHEHRHGQGGRRADHRRLLAARTSGGGIHPLVLLRDARSPAPTSILTLGGVQAIAAMAYGLFTGKPADVIVGPGNKYVAEAKRTSSAGWASTCSPARREIGIIADDSADPGCRRRATWSARPSTASSRRPGWCRRRRALAQAVMERRARADQRAAREPAAAAAGAAWRDYGEVVVAADREEAARISDDYAPEHLEVHARDLDWWLSRLTCYGSLFLGEETTVAYGDKASGPNHILPTMGAARYSGGLSVTSS